MVQTSAASIAVSIFAANERINQLLIEQLPGTAWNAKTPGNVRTIAAIFSHIHNVRTKWIRLTAPHLKVPGQVNRARCTPPRAQKALAESGRRCEEMLFAVGAGRINKFARDGWAKDWPAGPALLPRMLSYMLAHEAHHRGQIMMLAHQLGYPLSSAFTSQMWNWEKLWKQN
jgi:uncharacterized damage-inducible protein DinB